MSHNGNPYSGRSITIISKDSIFSFQEGSFTINNYGNYVQISVPDRRNESIRYSVECWDFIKKKLTEQLIRLSTYSNTILIDVSHLD